MTLDPNSPEYQLRQEQLKTEMEGLQAERERQRRLSVFFAGSTTASTLAKRVI